MWVVLRFKTVLACAAAAGALPLSALAAPFAIDLPSQEAARSIPEFGRQANVQIIAPVSQLHGVRTPAVRGTMEIEEALKQLLVGTGLELAANDGTTIVLRRAQPAARNAGTAPAITPPAPGTETVTVTGSRLITDIANSPTPVTSVDAEQLAATTPSDLPDALNKLPVILGGRTPRTIGNGSTNNSGNVLALRGFGAARTLVLLDGRRVPAANQDGTVNVDTLPQMLIARVDIVTGGASAVYGSDAVAGVINFVLDKNFTGFKYHVNAGLSKYGDGAEWQLGAAWGSELLDGRGHVEMSARWRSQDMVPISARPYGFDGQAWLQAGMGTPAAPFVDISRARTFNMSQHGTVSCGAACSVNNHTFNQAGILSPMVHGVPSSTANLESGGDGGYVKHGTFRSKVRTAEWFGRFRYRLNDAVEAHLQASWNEAGNGSDWVNWVVSSASSRPNALFADNPFLGAAAQASLGAGIACGSPASVGWNCLPATPPLSPQTGSTPPPPPATPYFMAPSHAWSMIGGEPAARQNRLYMTQGLQRNLSLEAGLAGRMGGFSWDAYYSHGESRLKVTNPANTDNARYLAALDAVVAPAGTVVNGVDLSGSIACWVATQPQFAALYPGCTPANVTDPGGPSVAAFEFLRQPTWWILTQTMDHAGGAIRGGLWDLPGGEITAALSAEMRWHRYRMESRFLPTDFVDCTGLRLCLANGGAPVRWVQNVNAPVDAENSVREVALEVNVPLLRNVTLARDLSLDLAGRFADYSTSGAVQTWKIGVSWHLDDDVQLRSTMSVDIRAPNLNDLYQPAGISSTGFTDLLTGGNRSTQLVSRGNAMLQPEVARTYTAGMVLQPASLPGFSLSLDWYATRMSSAITPISYQNVAVQNLCLASAPSYTSPFCALAVRPIADPAHPDYRNPAVNFPTQILNAPVNAARQQMEGFDIEVNYHWNMRNLFGWWPGLVGLRHLMTYQPVNTTINIPGTFPTWAVVPKTRMTTFLQYSHRNWSVALQNQWLSGMKKASSDNSLNGNTQNYLLPRLGSWNVLDLTIAKRFALWGSRSEAYLTVNNIGDTGVPLSPSGAGIPGLFYPTTGFHDDMGRYFTVGIRGDL
jgi:outer membrane receptor protein involved in Fe transport